MAGLRFPHHQPRPESFLSLLSADFADDNFVYGSDAQNVATYAGFDNYTPVATFRPCTYNGVAGMWHVEGNAFYGNTAEAGTLTVLNDS